MIFFKFFFSYLRFSSCSHCLALLKSQWVFYHVGSFYYKLSLRWTAFGTGTKQWRIQRRGPVGPAPPSPLFLDQTEGGKNVFWDRPPAPPLIWRSGSATAKCPSKSDVQLIESQMERQRPTLGVRFTVEVSVKRESTVYLFFLLIILQLSDLGIEIEERDGGIFVKEVQEHGCVAVHGKLAHLGCMVVDACYTCEKGHSSLKKLIKTQLHKICMCNSWTPKMFKNHPSGNPLPFL